jgi:hypothetical protein
MNKSSFHISREELKKILKEYKDKDVFKNTQETELQKLRQKVSDKELLDSIDDNIIESYLRSKKIKKIKNKI